jgi:hypothetical protein
VTVDVITVVQQPTAVITVVQQPTTVVSVVQVGPQGPPGTAGASTEYIQASPASVWGPITVPTGLGRRPNVAVYLGGELVAAFVTASSTQVTISFPTPVTGSAVLN